MPHTGGYYVDGLILLNGVSRDAFNLPANIVAFQKGMATSAGLGSSLYQYVSVAL